MSEEHLVAEFRRRLEVFYNHYAPEKVASIDSILKKVDGRPDRFELLLSKLVEKYGEEPEDLLVEQDVDEIDEESEANNGEFKINLDLEKRITNFYLYYNESKLPNVRNLVIRTKNNPKYEKRLMRMLAKKYGPEPSVAETSVQDKELEHFRQRLYRFYENYQPNKLSGIDSLVAKATTKDSQEQLIKMLVSKYGPEPVEKAAAKVLQVETVQKQQSGPFRNILYCPVDGMPAEYCEYLNTFEDCLPWLLQNFPDLKLSTKGDRTVKQYHEDLERNGESEEKKKKDNRGGKARPNKNKNKRDKKNLKEEAKVTIERTNRSKRKYITVVTGLDSFDVKLKEAAKKLGKRFACSASVSKLPGGGQSIDIQGDVCFELVDVLLENYPEIDKNKVFLIEDGKETKAS